MLKMTYLIICFVVFVETQLILDWKYPRLVYIDAGSTTSFVCRTHLTHNVTIIWKKENIILNKAEDTSILKYNIGNADELDKSCYQCVVSTFDYNGKIIDDCKEICVNIADKPIFYNNFPQTDIKFYSNQKTPIKLSCSAYSFLKLSYYWYGSYFINKNIKENIDEIFIDEFENFGSDSISCMVKNEVGYIQRSFSITVLSEYPQTKISSIIVTPNQIQFDITPIIIEERINFRFKLECEQNNFVFEYKSANREVLFDRISDKKDLCLLIYENDGLTSKANIIIFHPIRTLNEQKINAQFFIISNTETEVNVTVKIDQKLIEKLDLKLNVYDEKNTLIITKNISSLKETFQINSLIGENFYILRVQTMNNTKILSTSDDFYIYVESDVLKPVIQDINVILPKSATITWKSGHLYQDYIITLCKTIDNCINDHFIFIQNNQSINYVKLNNLEINTDYRVYINEYHSNKWFISDQRIFKTSSKKIERPEDISIYEFENFINVSFKHSSTLDHIILGTIIIIQYDDDFSKHFVPFPLNFHLIPKRNNYPIYLLKIYQFDEEGVGKVFKKYISGKKKVKSATVYFLFPLILLPSSILILLLYVKHCYPKDPNKGVIYKKFKNSDEDEIFNYPEDREDFLLVENPLPLDCLPSPDGSKFQNLLDQNKLSQSLVQAETSCSKLVRKIEKLKEQEFELLYKEYLMLTNLSSLNTKNLKNNKEMNIFNDYKFRYDNLDRNYIIMKAPMKYQINHFYEYIWNNKPSLIVMMNYCQDPDFYAKRRYLPKFQKQAYEKFEVSIVSCSNITLKIIKQTVRLFNLQTDTYIEFNHIIFSDWPDEEEIPFCFNKFCDLQYIINDSFTKFPNKPVLIHCDDGIRKSGVVLAINILFNEALINSKINVLMEIDRLRKLSKQDLVTNPIQLMIVYQALFELCYFVEDIIDLSNFNKIVSKEEFNKIKQNLLNNNTTFIASKRENKKKNRDAESCPYDQNLISLCNNDAKIEYINASEMFYYNSNESYIISQTPLENTINEFWDLVWSKDVHIIVNLHYLGGIVGKITQYFPIINNSILTNNMKIMYDSKDSCITTSTQDGTIETNIFQITHKSGEYRVIEYVTLYNSNINEPSHIPIYTINRICSIILKSSTTKEKEIRQPILLHCKNGCDMSGIFVASLLALEQFKMNTNVNVSLILRSLLTQRHGLFKKYEDYLAINEIIKLTMSDLVYV